MKKIGLFCFVLIMPTFQGLPFRVLYFLTLALHSVGYILALPFASLVASGSLHKLDNSQSLS